MANIKIKENISDAFDTQVSDHRLRARPWRTIKKDSFPQEPKKNPKKKTTLSTTPKTTLGTTLSTTLSTTETTLSTTPKTTLGTTLSTTPKNIIQKNKYLYISQLPLKKKNILEYLSSIRDFENPNQTCVVGLGRIAQKVGTDRGYVQKTLKQFIDAKYLAKKESYDSKYKGSIYDLSVIIFDSNFSEKTTLSTTLSTPICSSSKYNTTTIDLASYHELRNIGLDNGHIKQILNKNILNQTELEKSLDYIEWSLKNKTLKTESPLKYIMGILLRGPFNRPDGYKTPKEVWLEREAEHLREESKKLKQLEEEIFESQYIIWKSKLTPEEINEISPMFKQDGVLLESILKSHFETKVFQPILSSKN